MINTDTAVMISTLTILSVLGLLMPFVLGSFSNDTYATGGESIVNQAGQEGVESDGFIKTFTSMYFWTYGITQNIFIEGILELIRIAFYISLFRTLRGN